jgi:hypothetical protein
MGGARHPRLTAPFASGPGIRPVSILWVIDAKRQGRPELESKGGILGPRVEKVLVGRRDCTKLVDGALKKVDLLRDVVDKIGQYSDVGTSRIYLQVLDLHDLDHVELVASEVLNQLS